MAQTHISNIRPKTAENIVKELLPHAEEDAYHCNIREAAAMLVRHDRGAWKYETQWASGSTLWIGPDGTDGQTVTREMVRLDKILLSKNN